MHKVIRFSKNVALGGFLILLFGAYYELADRFAPVTIYRDMYGHSVFNTDHHTFFYTLSSFTILSNILLSLIVRVFRQMPLERWRIPQRDFWTSDKKHIRQLHEVFEAWLYAFGLIFNVFMFFLVGKIWFVNRGASGLPHEYLLMASVLVGALLIWAWFIRYRLRIARTEYVK